MKWMAKLEQKFGKIAIPHLTLVLIGTYIVGYILQFAVPGVSELMTLNPYAICQGQVWRLVSWLLIPPPENNIFFGIIMLLFYFSIGSTLERAWGDFQYNIYLFAGMLFTIAGAFLLYGVLYLLYFNPTGIWNLNFQVIETGQIYTHEYIFQLISNYFTTYYVNMSIFLAYAATFPDNKVLLMFFIPIKVKVLGFIYGGYLAYETLINIYSWKEFGMWYVPLFTIGASLLNFLLFFLTTRRYILKGVHKSKTQREYHKHVSEFKRNERVYSAGVGHKHQCAVCGRTEKDNDQLVFRFCSKCEGNFEYCQDHLYTHTHYSAAGPIPKAGPDIIDAGKDHVEESVYHQKQDRPDGFY